MRSQRRPRRRPALEWSPDDLYILYTGGTTGMPKGVLWRNGDAMVECFGGSKTAASIDEFVAAATAGTKALLAPPFMHGAGHWMSFLTWLGGGTVFVQSITDRLDPVDIWSLVEREQVNFLLIVGDAFARPLLDELDQPTGGRRTTCRRSTCCCRAVPRCRRTSRTSSSRICRHS